MTSINENKATSYMNRNHLLAGMMGMLASAAVASPATAHPTMIQPADTTSGSVSAAATDSVGTMPDQTLNEVSVVRRKPGMMRMKGPLNGQLISQDELFKAACCNLGESFTTNPSVDVSYNDAATGAKQIKLLGLSGKYVQMLTENLPNFRGAAIPYSLGYVPGPWMKSIQVSKGNASVRTATRP